MKNLVFLVVLLFSGDCIAQGLTDSYLNFGVDYGIRPQKLLQNDLDFSITDNNGKAYDYPVDLSDFSTPKGLNIFLGFGRYKGISHRVFFDLTLGDNDSGRWGYNIGYNVAIEVGRQDLLIRPSVGWSFGGGSVKLASEKFDSLNPFVFQDLSIGDDIEYVYEHTLNFATPSIEATLLINQKIAFHAKVGYDVQVKNNGYRIVLISKDLETSESFKEFSDQINTSSDGTFFQERLVDYQGLWFSFGISKYINRQVFNY